MCLLRGAAESGAGAAWVSRPSAQRVHAFAKAEGLEIAGEHTEVETGKGADALDRQPQLAAALKAGEAPAGFRVWRSSTRCPAMSPSSRG